MSSWSTRFDLRHGDTDYLGHVTATVHLELFEEARTRWFGEIMDDRWPAFVVVRQELDYRRELRLDDGPVTVTVRPLELTRSTVRVHQELQTNGDQLHTEAVGVLVRWDGEHRRSMPFPEAERERILAQVTD